MKVYYANNNVTRMKDKHNKLEYLLSDLHIPRELRCVQELEWDEKNPDILFANESIYYYKTQNDVKSSFEKCLNNNPITVFLAGECIEPDLNIFDYAIIFDRNLENERLIRMPTFLRFSHSIFQDENNISSVYEATKEQSKKTSFCNFIYSNANAHPMRDKLFYEISKYKKVDSLGKHLRNVQDDVSRTDISDWRKESIEIKKNYKFSISSENASYRGYVSEKILTSFQAQSVPIYWGDPDIGVEFNKNAFINANDYKSLNDLLSYIIQVDNDVDLWNSFIMEPWQSDEQKRESEKERDAYYNFVTTILSNPNRMKAEGFHPDLYRASFSQWYTQRTLLEKAKTKADIVLYKLKNDDERLLK